MTTRKAEVRHKRVIKTCIEPEMALLLKKWNVTFAQCMEVGFFVCESIRKAPTKKEVDPKLFMENLYERAKTLDDVQEWISRVKGNSMWAEFKGWRAGLLEQKRELERQKAFDEHRTGDVK